MDANPKRIKKDAFSKISGYVWTGLERSIVNNDPRSSIINRKNADSQAVESTSPWYGVVQCFMKQFFDRVQNYWYSFQQLFTFSKFMGMIFCKNSFIGELFEHLRIYGYFSENFPDSRVILLLFV